MSVLTSSPILRIKGVHTLFIFLVWPVYLQDLFLFFAFFAEFGSSRALAFQILSLHTWAASMYFSQATCPFFHCLSISLHLSWTSCMSLHSHAGFLPSLSDFLHKGIAVWKMSLKRYQLWSGLIEGFLNKSTWYLITK